MKKMIIAGLMVVAGSANASGIFGNIFGSTAMAYPVGSTFQSQQNGWIQPQLVGQYNTLNKECLNTEFEVMSNDMSNSTRGHVVVDCTNTIVASGNGYNSSEFKKLIQEGRTYTQAELMTDKDKAAWAKRDAEDKARAK